jgi:DNA-directed RNA polymerase specialized sigma24 family protein
MHIVSQDSDTAETVRRQDAAVELLAAHREAKERLRRSEEHVIVAASDAGLSLRRIADILGCSRGPVYAALARAGRDAATSRD